MGVVQLINKAGGASFSNNDEELLSAICSLTAIAIENTSLFYKTKQICHSLGLMIKHATLQEAVKQICDSSVDIIGVECAGVYLYNREEDEVYRFNEERNAKEVLPPSALRHSIVERALSTKKIIAVNDVQKCPFYNSEVDNLCRRPPEHVSDYI